MSKRNSVDQKCIKDLTGRTCPQRVVQYWYFLILPIQQYFHIFSIAQLLKDTSEAEYEYFALSNKLAWSISKTIQSLNRAVPLFFSFMRLWTMIFRRKWFRRVKDCFLCVSFACLLLNLTHLKNSHFLRIRATLNDCIFSKWTRKIYFSLMDELSKRYFIAQMNARNEHHWNRCLNL